MVLQISNTFLDPRIMEASADQARVKEVGGIEKPACK